MKTALDNYELGKQQEVSADKFDYIIRDSHRFLCPECLESVTMVDGKLSKYFKHHKKTLSSIECDRRVEASESHSISERVGLPLFLRKNNNKYSLCVGFRPLSEDLLYNCEKEKAYLQIIGKHTNKVQKYYINSLNFSFENVVYKQLEIANSENLKVQFFSASYSKKLNSIWSNYIETSIFSYGALFQSGKCGGKIIRVGDCISTFKPYIWVKPVQRYFFYNDDFLDGMKFKKTGQLFVEDVEFEVFEGSFDIHSSNAITFQRVANYLLNRLKLFLLDGESSVFPIWPPVIRNEIGYQSLEKDNIYYIVHSNNEFPKVYSYISDSSVPQISSVKKEESVFVNKSYVSSYGLMINVDRKVVSNGTYMRTIPLKRNIISNYYLQDADNEEVNELYIIDLQTGTNTDVYIIDRNFKIEKFVFEDGKVNLKVKKSMNFIVIICDSYLVKFYEVITENDEIQNLDITEILRASKSSENVAKVMLNSKLFRMMRELSEKNSELKKCFMVYMNEKKIPVTVVKILERIDKI